MSSCPALVRSFPIAAVLNLVATMAQAIPISNPSFEIGTLVNDGTGTMVLPVNSLQITGWTVVTDQLAWITSPNSWGLTANDGDRFLDLTAYPTGAPFGGIRQTLSTTAGEVCINFPISRHLHPAMGRATGLDHRQRWQCDPAVHRPDPPALPVNLD